MRERAETPIAGWRGAAIRREFNSSSMEDPLAMLTLNVRSWRSPARGRSACPIC
jgi:hypothetical protein